MPILLNARNRFRKTLCVDLRWIDASGVGVYIKGIMPGILERLHDILIIGLGDRSRLMELPWSREANFRAIDCRARRYSLIEQIELPFAIPSNVDLLFSPYYTIPLLYRGNLAVTVHDMSHLVVGEIVSNPLKRAYAKAMYSTVRKRASVIFTVSNFSRMELLRLTKGQNDDNIFVTHLGISTEWYDAAKSLPIRSGPYFVCVGNIKPYKNLRRLVEAFFLIKDQIPHDLVIAGQSEGLITGESSDFFARVSNAGDRIHLTGYISQEDLLSLVGHAEALIMPSLYEGFGLPPLEAMAAGVPVLASGVASLPEVCGHAALYFDPLNVDEMAAMLKVIATNPESATRLKHLGLERSREFTWQSCAQKTADQLLVNLN